MTVREAKEVVWEWVIQKASKTSDFCGAFYHGSVNWLAEDTLLPATSDVDIIVVFADQPHSSPGKFNYENVILEVSYLSIIQLPSAEQILGQYYLAGSFRQPNIIADPAGHFQHWVGHFTFV